MLDWIRKRPFLTVSTLLIVAVGLWAGPQLIDLATTPTYEVSDDAPDAPPLKAASGETLYRIDPNESSASYAVDEKLGGKTRTTAMGTSSGIAGDFAINRQNPAKSRVGTIVLNIEQFTSDSTLRDNRIRHDYLQSHTYPLAKFETEKLTGLPGEIEEGKTYEFQIQGDLTVKEITKAATFDVVASIANDTLTGTASTQIKMSDYEIGPINVIGLVSTSNEVDLELDISAVDPSSRDIANYARPERKKTSTTESTVSFANQVQPIIEENCAGCHLDGGIGNGDWPIETVADVAEVAPDLALATGAKYMPPWPAAKGDVELQHPRGLSDTEIETIATWATEGGQLDVDKQTTIADRTEEPPIPEADLKLTWDEPYAGDGTEKDDYRCFLIDPGFTEPTFVTGYWVEPGRTDVVHHALIHKVPAEAKTEAEAKDGEDGRPGWECNVGTGLDRHSALPTPGNEAQLFSGWVPGQRPLNFGDEAGFLFEAGEQIIVQIHYHYEHEFPKDQSHLVLQTEPGDSGLRPLDSANPIAPVEVPCADGEESKLCDRSAALAKIREEFGPIAAAIPDYALGECGRSPDEYQHLTKGSGRTSCTFEVGRDGELVDFLGHMHELGESFKMTLNPGTPEEKLLLHIPRWDFNWQLNYQPVDPIPVKATDTIEIECTWDRSLRYDPEPRYLLFSEGTEDEMCFSTYTVIPAEGDTGDLAQVG